MLQIGAFSITSSAVLAPMAGITDRPFRELAARYGAGMVVSEMIASQEMVEAKASTRARAELADGVPNAAVQIAGREAHWMAEAARLVEDQGAQLIDINMGCPAKKVTSGASGAALMRDPVHAASLIRAVRQAVSVPVTVKMRLGWDESELNAVELARLAEGEGAQAITVHGRTRCQFYKGTADWAQVAPVVASVEIPVIVNGDIRDPASARRALALSGAQAVMVGRGAQGALWLPGQIGAALDGAPPVTTPEGLALADLICEHYERQLAFYGRALGVRTARKHLSWYLDRLAGAAPLRAAIIREENPNRVLRLLRAALLDLEPKPVAA